MTHTTSPSLILYTAHCHGQIASKMKKLTEVVAEEESLGGSPGRVVAGRRVAGRVEEPPGGASDRVVLVRRRHRGRGRRALRRRWARQDGHQGDGGGCGYRRRS